MTNENQQMERDLQKKSYSYIMRKYMWPMFSKEKLGKWKPFLRRMRLFITDSEWRRRNRSWKKAQKFSKKLRKRCPIIYRSVPRVWNWDIGIGKGWRAIVWNLSLKIEKVAQDDIIVIGEEGYIHDQLFLVLQVKEKFGGLCFYISGGTDETRELIREAENLSLVTCEWCGKPGSLDNRFYWLLTLCEECQRKRNKMKSGFFHLFSKKSRKE